MDILFRVFRFKKQKLGNDQVGQAIGETGLKLRDQLYETPQTVSWDRVNMRLPQIMYELIDVIEQEKMKYQ